MEWLCFIVYQPLNSSLYILNIRFVNKFFVGNIFKRARVSIKHCYLTQLAQISLTFSRPPSLSSIAPGKSSRLPPVSSQSSCRYVLAGHPSFARPCEGVHRSTILVSSSLLFQQCPACLVCLIWIVFVIDGM